MLMRLELCTRDKGENYQYHHLYYCLSRLVMYPLGKMEILPLELFSVVKATTNLVVCPSVGLVQIVMWMVTQLVNPTSSLREEIL